MEDSTNLEELGLGFLVTSQEQLPKKVVINNAKIVLEKSFPKLYVQASLLKEPSMVANYKIDNIPGTTKPHMDTVSDTIEIKEMAIYEVGLILKSIERLSLPKKKHPDHYYKRILWLRYIDPKYWKMSTAEICIQLAKEFPARLDDKDKYNPYFMDMHVYSKDLRDALFAFAEQYKNRALFAVDLKRKKAKKIGEAKNKY